MNFFHQLIFLNLDSLPQSMKYRLKTWNSAIEDMNTINLIFGQGFGKEGIYVDGLWVKLFAETGLIGLFLTFSYLSILMRKYIFLLVPFCLTCFTLDTMTSSKIMFSFYFVLISLEFINNSTNHINKVS